MKKLISQINVALLFRRTSMLLELDGEKLPGFLQRTEYIAAFLVEQNWNRSLTSNGAENVHKQLGSVLFSSWNSGLLIF
jgi:hypothetical protein